MTTIKNIPPFPNDLSESEKTKQAQKEKETISPSSDPAKGDPRPGKDKVTISDTGQALLQEGTEVNKYVNAFSRLPDTDHDRLAAIKAKVMKGEYLKDVITDVVVENLFQEIKRETQDPPSSRPVDITAIREKINQGQYNTDEIVAVIVRRILDEEF
ncbi:MAG: hypothetical protein ACE5D8_02020 [Fidelibacterota bacterium]